MHRAPRRSVCLLASNRHRAACLLFFAGCTRRRRFRFNYPTNPPSSTIAYASSLTLPPHTKQKQTNSIAKPRRGKPIPMAVINSEGESALPDVTRKGVEERIKALMAEAEGGGISKDK